jgi:ATP-dependent RNA helicase RhlE
VSKLRAGPEIVVATPGRLLDHLGQGTINLSKVEILVLDEADRMLDMGFIRDIRKVIAVLPPKRQNLLFSATFSDDITQLADGMLHDPAHVQVTPRNTTTELIDQLVIPVDRERKRDLLRELVALGRVKQALVFTRTKHGANRLAEQLRKDGIEASAIHGNRSQSQRVKALSDFKEGRCAILVATDIAARGLDIEQLPHVVNFELPMVPEDYVHRIGRTGRAGIDGQAISLVCVDETPLLRAIQGLLKKQIPSEVIAGFEPDRSIRPEPIRLRSTPIERRQIALEKAARGAGGGNAAGRGPAPIRHPGPAREESVAAYRGAAPSRGHGGQGGGRNGRPGAPRPITTPAGEETFVARPPRTRTDAGQGGHTSHRSAGGPGARTGGGPRRSGRGMGSGTPGTGFGNAAPGGRPASGGGRPASGGRTGGYPQGSGRPAQGAGRPQSGGGRPAQGYGGRPAQGHGGQGGHAGGAARSLPGERLSRPG